MRDQSNALPGKADGARPHGAEGIRAWPLEVKGEGAGGEIAGEIDGLDGDGLRSWQQGPTARKEALLQQLKAFRQAKAPQVRQQVKIDLQDQIARLRAFQPTPAADRPAALEAVSGPATAAL